MGRFFNLSLFFLPIFQFLLLNSCSSPFSSTLQPTHFIRNALTIDYHISVGDQINFYQKQQIQKVIDTTFQEIDTIYNKWNPCSEISLLNNLPAHTPHLLSPQLHQFLQRLDLLV